MKGHSPPQTPEALRRTKYVGAWLRQLRNERLETISDCTERSGIPRATISWLEQGKADVYGMSLRTIVKISRAYYIKPEALLRRLKVID
jgi:transcriptional regulator with XRE-family HTH domain